MRASPLTFRVRDVFPADARAAIDALPEDMRTLFDAAELTLHLSVGHKGRREGDRIVVPVTARVERNAAWRELERRAEEAEKGSA